MYFPKSETTQKHRLHLNTSLYIDRTPQSDLQLAAIGRSTKPAKTIETRMLGLPDVQCRFVL